MTGKAPRVFYTSDLHIGHRRVAAIRGFEDPLDHDADLVSSWVDQVRPQDVVFVLGDVAMSRFDYALALVDALPGVKHLIVGNHDPVHPAHRQTFARVFPRWAQTFASIAPFTRRRLVGREVLLSHFPYESWGDGPTRPGSRWNQYRLPDLGLPLLHGHTHGDEVAHGSMFHVGLDAHGGRLVPQDDVIAWLETQPADRKASLA